MQTPSYWTLSDDGDPEDHELRDERSEEVRKRRSRMSKNENLEQSTMPRVRWS